MVNNKANKTAQPTNNTLKSKRRLRSVAAMIIAAIASIVFAYLVTVSNHAARLDKQTLSKLIDFDNCASAKSQLEDLEPNPDQPQESIRLLSFKSFCYANEGNFKAAIDTERQLKNYYTKQGNAVAVSRIDSHIKYMEAQIKSSNEPSQVRPDTVSPKLREEIKKAEAEQ